MIQHLPDKTRLRREQAELRRQALPGVERAIRRQVEDLVARWPGEGGLLGVYWPLRHEVDLRRLAAPLPLALPAVSEGQLRYRPWDGHSSLEADDCGIPAPAAAAGELRAPDLSLLLIPALAIDRQGFRLGYGGGWYDRLRCQPDWRQVPCLAVLPQACLTARLPHDAWDIPLDGWVSEQGWQWL
jgi:5-formyltetrahydrofolate cyclo-ligase